MVVQLYLMPAVFLVVLVLGLPLNIFSLWIFSHRLGRWTRSSVLLFNLALADTFWLLALPFLIYYHLDHVHWGLGQPLCKAMRLFYHNYFYLSIYFVACISVDRYLAIVHPLRSLLLLGRRQTYLLCVTMWVVNVAISLPVVDMTTTQLCPGDNRTICTLYLLLENTVETMPYSLCCTCTGFLFPLVSICYCCPRSLKELRSRPHLPHRHNRGRRLTRVLSAVLILFAVFYLPYHLTRNAVIIVRMVDPNDPTSWRAMDLAFSLEMCLCSLNTCINPLFSCFVGRQFRKEFLDTFCSLCHKRPRPGALTTSQLPKQGQGTMGHGMNVTPL